MKLYLGDCLEVMKDIPDQSIGMILTDLPYGTVKCKWDTTIPFEPMWKQYKRVIKDVGCIALFGSEPFSSSLRLSNLEWYKYDWIWKKTEPSGHFQAKKRPLRLFETISIFYKDLCNYYPQKKYGCKRKTAICKVDRGSNSVYNKDRGIRNYDSTERYPVDVLEYSRKKQTNKLHPTQKPVELLEYLIKTYTEEGEIVLDSCMGSGSTGVACKNLNRQFIGIEKEEEYFNIAKKRILGDS